MNTTLTQEQKRKFISKALSIYCKTTPTSRKPLYVLYKDYSYFIKDNCNKDNCIYSQGDLKDIIEPNKPMYGIITANEQYMQYLKNNGFVLIYTYQKLNNSDLIHTHTYISQ